jgi:hypothetical protein
MRNQKGVSMITLVITIIVVIILAAIALGGGATDSITQGQFSGFASEVATVQEAVDVAMFNAQGDEVQKGNTRTDAQLYNFIARGGIDVVDDNKEWLVQADAASIPCTLINEQYAKDSIGVELPVRRVETYKGTNQNVSYYVTPKGQVFVWPPYMYQDKSYITGDVTVKSGDAAFTATTYASAPELAGTDATMKTTVFAFFPKTNETVVISNADATVPHTMARGDGTSATLNWKTTTPGVIYRAVADSGDRGVAEGIQFGIYNNSYTPAL